MSTIQMTQLDASMTEINKLKRKVMKKDRALGLMAAEFGITTMRGAQSTSQSFSKAVKQNRQIEAF